MKKTAIILGATGLTGNALLHMLLDSDDYDTVKLFTRTSTTMHHPKLEEIVCDLLKLDDYADEFIADEVFCCIGTTKKKTPNKHAYQAIDYGIPVTAAGLSAQNNIAFFSVISALGADAKSKVFYNRTKGEMEQAVLACDIDNILIYRPSLIFGDRGEKRFGEDIGVKLFNALPLSSVKVLQKYNAISGQQLAHVLLLGVNHYQGKKIIARDEFLVDESTDTHDI